jgi:hypothetical protein
MTLGLHSTSWIVLAIALLSGPALAAAPSERLQNSDKVHALVVGIDQYRHLPQLRGAVADARDITTVLEKAGVSDIVSLLDEDAKRDRIMAEIEHLKSRVKPGDLVILSLAGHGAQEPERIKGSEQDGTEAVFLLTDFDSTAAATRERILDQEFNHIIKGLEAAGAQVLFVADSCSGGGLARSVDTRSANLVYRAAPKYQITDDELKPISTASDAFSTNLSFDRSIFLAAVDKYSKAPEIQVPGVSGYRGALSYALARAIEGAADANGDGDITIKELFDYVRDVTYQLSDQRQNIVSLNAPNLKTAEDSVFKLTRSVRVADAPSTNASASQLSQRDIPAKASSQLPPAKPIRLASLDEKNSSLAGLEPIDSPFQVVPAAQADFIWDPETGDVISAGDVIARNVARSDLPSIVDRAASIRVFKQLAAHAPQEVRLLPDSQVHKRGTLVEMKVNQVSGRTMFLFDIASDGTVQMLYPAGAASKVIGDQQYSARFQVREPFGADQIVAVTAPQRIPELEQGFAQLGERRTSRQIAQMLSRYADSGLRIGLISIFTSP